MADRTLKVEIVGDARSLQRTFGKAADSGDKLGKSFISLGKAAAAAGVALTAGVAVGLKKSVDAASDLQEQVNKANVVFRGSEKEVLNWSKGLASSFGLSQRAALEAAGTFGNMLVPMGLTRDAAAQMSERMTELGGDMASFNNASIEDTLLAIRSGLAGETEPLRKFGVFLSAARVEQEALTETGKKSAKQLTDQEKVTARYNLILKDTADTQGDFARSAGTSVANQLRIAKAQFENLAATVGSVFLPVVLKVLDFVNKRLIPGLAGAADAIGDFWGNIQQGFARAPNFRAKVNVVIENVRDLAGRFVDALADQIASLLPQKEVPLNFRFQHRGGETMAGGVDWNAIATDIIAALSEALRASTDLAKSLATTITEAINRINWVDVGRSFGPGLAAALAAAVATALDPAFWVKNWDLALAIASVAFGGAIGRVAGRLATALGSTMLGIVARISPQFAAAFGRLVDDAGRAFVAVWGRVGGRLEGLVSGFFKKLGSIATFTIKVLGVQVAINAIGDFVSAAIGKLRELLGWLERLPGRIQGVFADAGSWLYDAGAAILQGLWDGLKSKWNAVADWLGGLGGRIRDLKGPPAKDAALLTDIGELIMQGLERGFRGGWESRVEPYLSGLSDKIRDKVSTAVQGVAQASDDFASAFETLASDALGAFDAAVSQWQPKAQLRLDRLHAKEQLAQLKADVKEGARGVAEAQAELQKALAGGDPEQIRAAQQAVTDALASQLAARRALRDYNLEQEAEAQQEAHDKQAARERIRFANELAALQNAYASQEITTKQFHARLNKLMAKHGVDQEFFGTAIGIQFANGIQKSTQAVVNAITRLLKRVERLLKFRSPPAEGPLSDVDTWWNQFIPTLIGGADTSAVTAFGNNLGGLLTDALGVFGPAGAGGLTDFGTGVNAAADAAVGAFERTGAAKDSLGQNFQEFSTSAVLSNQAVSDSVGTIATTMVKTHDIVGKEMTETLKEQKPLIADLKRIFDGWADSIRAIGAAAIAARNQLRDSMAEIAAAAGTSLNLDALLGRASGGPVSAGRGYVVGENGPELFIPNTSGYIAPGTSGGGSVGMGLTQNFYGPVVGTGREFEDTVRRALYDVQRRNPGTGLAMA